jgi:ribonuclease VapC
MILETSALVAILRQEAEAPRLTARISKAVDVAVPAHVVLEASMVLGGQVGREGLAVIDAYLHQIGATILPFTALHAQVAREAFLSFGKGRHRAALNFGDCMSYAVAKAEGLPLLFVGDDFARTDVAGA